MDLADGVGNFLPDAVFIYLSSALPDNLWIVNICVFIEQFGYGFGFTAYMLYLIYYSDGEHKTAHYAICTAFYGFGPDASLEWRPAGCRNRWATKFLLVGDGMLPGDGGSNETDWSVVSGNWGDRLIRTGGINPFFQTEEEISAEIRDNLIPRIRESDSVGAVYFYGAGVRFRKRTRLYAVLSRPLSAGPGGGRQ